MNSFNPQLCEGVAIINLIYKWKNKDTGRQNNVASDTQPVSGPAGVLKLFFISELKLKYEPLEWKLTSSHLNVIGGFKYGFFFLVTLTSHS